MIKIKLFVLAVVEFFLFSSFICYAGNILNSSSLSANSSPVKIPRFSISPYFNEQVLTFTFNPEVRIQINAPSTDSFDQNKSTEIIFFALPNGNTIEQTVGKILKPGDDWHFDIQHIGAQTRFIRQHETNYNVVTVYLETSQLAWPTWRSKYSNNAILIKNIVDSVKNIFNKYNPFVVLSGHSGGGGFTFSYLNSVSDIPIEIKRISFLDSDYNYDDSYGPKILNWLNSSSDHFLSVIAYNDSVALYNGQPVVSPTGGTWYRSKMMQKYLSNYFTFIYEEDTNFIKYTALNGRIKFILKQNPTRAILHTVQVELNGFIQGIFSGTVLEGINYEYYGSRAYSSLIQSELRTPKSLTIPPRPSDAISGSAFMQKVWNMTFDQREAEIYNEISKGNIPDFLRNMIQIKSIFQDASGKSHTVYYQTMPDYLAIGSNDDYCRIPTGPITAQKLAILFGANLTTSKLTDDIYLNSTCKLAPVTYPWSDTSTMVIRFQQHSYSIDSERVAANGILGELTGGLKKDVVISNKIIEKPNNVVIYGWHQLNGIPIQPLYNGHINSYLDYSHGIRLINNEVLVDSVIMTVPQILRDPVLYKILSNESGAMLQPSYLQDAVVPAKPKSFGIKSEGATGLKLILIPDTAAKQYNVYLSTDGINFSNPIILSPSDLSINNLKTDSLYFIKIKAVNSAGESQESEVLAGIPTTQKINSLIVNGFDRASTGNTYNFIRQHGKAFYSNGIFFESATNDAIVDGLFLLNDYNAADYILGDESTADETFSSSEQAKVISFLDNGGNLFASGSEIAWDLDYKGSVADKNFIWNFLKMKYVADAPNSKSGTYYQAEPIANSIAGNMPQFFFDNGTQGTINVLWPDIVKAVNGGNGFMKFVGVDTSAGLNGINFAGLFPNGTVPGKVVCLTFPFETVYPENVRTQLMKNILDYFNLTTGIEKLVDQSLPETFKLYQNYPNPFNPSTIIKYSIPKISKRNNIPVKLTIYDILGKKVAELVNEEKPAGNYEIKFDASRFSSGIYFYVLNTNEFSSSRKMILLK